MGIFKKALCSALASLTLLSVVPVVTSADTEGDLTENYAVAAASQGRVDEEALESIREAQLDDALDEISDLQKDIFQEISIFNRISAFVIKME